MYPSYKVDHFVTREGPLNEIQQHHQYSEQVVKAKVVVLLGIGGCGKSQMALEYCHQAEANRRFTAIFWVDASSPNTVAQSYTTIAATISKANIDMTDTAANIRLVKDMMSTWTTAWLLVFDNFDNPKAFTEKPVEDYFPRGKNGFILLTSRHAKSERLGHTITISNMLEAEALELLFRSSKCERRDENIAEGKKIIDRLGNLALAVDQAGAYIKGRIDFAAFLDHFNHRREDVLRTTPDIWAYRRKRNETEAEQSLSVATTWELSFDQIAGDPKNPTELESKRHLLTLSAFFNGQNIAEEIFQLSQNSDTLPWTTIFIRDGVWDKYRFLDVITELRNLSLIQNHVNGSSGVSFSLHPLIQDWIKLRLDSQDQQKYTTEALRIFSNYIGTQHTDKLAVQAKQIILSHLDTGLENSHKYLCGTIRLGESTLEAPALIFADFYLEQGRYEEAERLFGRVLKGREERLGRDHPDTLRTVHSLAIAYRRQGQYEQAERLFGRALKGREERLGRDHPDTLKTVHNLAIVYRRQGRYEEAERLSGRALKGYEERLGRNHPDTMRTVRNLTIVQRLMKPPTPPANL
jgi:tetratricopeptide (TPR) repeat protein